MCLWGYTAEASAKRLRENYLRAVLRQDIAFFDNVGAGEVATRIQTDTRKFLTLTIILSFLFIVFSWRLGPTRHIRESGNGFYTAGCLCYRLCPGLHSIVAACSRVVLHVSSHGNHRRDHD